LLPPDFTPDPRSQEAGFSIISMTNELTPKQEKFAQKYIELGNAAEAYRIAYDAENMKPVTIRRKAAELLEHGKVSAHVRALREAQQERHMVTIDSITSELEESRKLATADRQHSAAINASLGKAKLHGLIVDKSDVTVRKPISELTEAEIYHRRWRTGEYDQPIGHPPTSRLRIESHARNHDIDRPNR
jgi:hypothetical protein